MGASPEAACVFPRFHDTPECSNTYFSRQIISTQTRNRIKVCVCIVHEASWGDLPVFYVISPSLDYVSWFTVTSGSVISKATLLSLIFTPDFNQAVWCITLFVFIRKFPPGSGTDCAENGTNLIHVNTGLLLRGSQGWEKVIDHTLFLYVLNLEAF